jgi:hypothetical protein
MAFRSTYAGRCKACGMAFPEGTRITGTKGNWRHVSCGERRVATPGMGFVAAPVAPAPVARPTASEPDRLAAAVNAERSVVPVSRPPLYPFLADPIQTANAVEGRRRAAAEVAARRAPVAPVAPAPVTPEMGGRIARLDLDDEGRGFMSAEAGPGRIGKLELD